MDTTQSAKDSHRVTRRSYKLCIEHPKDLVTNGALRSLLGSCLEGRLSSAPLTSGLLRPPNIGEDTGGRFFKIYLLPLEYRLDLPQMVQVVSSHEAHHVSDAFFAALRVNAVVVQEFLRDGLQ